MAGSCSSCLVRIDGVPNRFACQTPVRHGMRIERQNAYPSVKVDVFSSIDWLFPKGMDHHSMFAGVPVAEKVMATVARHLAGLGLLPDAAPPCPAPRADLGGRRRGGRRRRGPGRSRGARGRRSGAARARAGRLRRGAPGARCSEDGSTAAPSSPAGVQLRLATSVLGLYDDELGRVLLPYARPRRQVLLIQARDVLFAVGEHASIVPFENNDIPGVFSGRAAADLLRRRRLLIGMLRPCSARGRSSPRSRACFWPRALRPGRCSTPGPARRPEGTMRGVRSAPAGGPGCTARLPRRRPARAARGL